MTQDPLLIFASRNLDKMREYEELLSEFPFSIKNLDDFDESPELEEIGQSLSDNALMKARIVASFYNLPAFSDDTGLEVFALEGAPGVYSSRYAGENSTNEQNIRKLLNALRDVPIDERGARFRTVIALCIPQRNGEIKELFFEGECEGLITTERRGGYGFGYDSVFYLPSLGMTFAEAGETIKNQVSHRHQAAKELVQFLEENLPFLTIVEN